MTVFNNQARVTLGGKRDSKGAIVDGFQGTVSGNLPLTLTSVTYDIVYIFKRTLYFSVLFGQNVAFGLGLKTNL